MPTIWNAEGVDFGNFYPVQASYGPRDIFAEAALVTNENVGQWALEFERDLAGQHSSEPFFEIFATREGESPIKLTIKAGFWVVKVWNELHVFKDGLFQSTFDVPAEQMRTARKAHRDRVIELEREWQKEESEVRNALMADMEDKFQRVLETGDWDELDISERQILMYRLKEDEKFRVFQVAAQLMMDAKKKALQEYAAKDAEVSQHLHIPISDLVEEIKKSGVGPDYHAGSLYKSEGQDPKVYEGFRPQVSIPIGLAPTGENETQIVPAVGELDTDESNGRLE